MFNGIIQTILVAFSMKVECTCMLSFENDDLNFLITVKNIKSTCNIFPGARRTVLSLKHVCF